MTVNALRLGLPPRRAGADDVRLKTQAMGREFPNPVGLAAGFDKNAEVPDAMLRLGFGFVEVGSVTPLAQPGNPRPRLFRLPEDRAVINRNGFNNEGLDVVERRLRTRRGRRGIVGANVGANKDSADRIGDYVACVKRLAGFAEFLTINISSPNTPGLRALQGRAALDELLERTKVARTEITPAGEVPVPLVLKIAPDLDTEGREIVAETALRHAIDGMIISNTTIARPPLKGRHRDEAGGLSGVPLMAPSTDLLGEMYKLTAGRIMLVGTGGISSGADAYAKLRAGATLVQLYTALVYAGPALVGRIKADLAALLAADGFACVNDAVGVDIDL